MHSVCSPMAAPRAAPGRLLNLRTGLSSFISLLSCLLVVSCFVGRDGEAAGEAGGARPPEFPAAWVLLEENPELWDAPGAEPTGSRLKAEALERVEVHDAEPGDDRAKRWLQVRTAEQTGWLPEALLAPPPTPVHPNHLHQIGQERVDRFRGIDPGYVPTDLVEIPFGYESGRTYRLRKEAATALETMIRRARRAGVSLVVVSAYRSYATQRRIYLGKLKRSGWLQDTVAKPGHSEHQLGTTVDLNGPDESTLLRVSFGETPEGQWLREHAPAFGFALSYTEFNSGVTGYAPEPWHYRYYGVEKAARRHAEALGSVED